MSYQVFARKFRPQDFEEVIGQDPIIQTLGNAISQKRISQSFLFSGPRGVGKTSTARILAKCLNCVKGPTGKPCNQCPSCQEITGGNSLDVLEIDGASNRGIEEIRNLRETVKFKPSHGHYKIYIIDEVHMLTTEAFNALLKTLEEPPEHVKFIFATTEAHKVPLTILSRCQRFNFKRITTAQTVAKLEEIAKKEKIKYDPEALHLIAKASEGALRDAESLLDQLTTFCKDKIKEKDVLSMLGLAAESVYFSLLDALKGKDASAVFKVIGELYDGGADLVQFGKGLLEIFRNLLLFQISDKAKTFVEASESAAKELKKRKNDFSKSELFLALSLLQNLQGQLRRNIAAPRLLVETALLKLIYLDGLHSVEDLQNTLAEKKSLPSAVRPTVSKSPTIGVTAASKVQTAPIPAKEKPAVVRESSSASPAAASQDGFSFADIETFWPRVIDYVKGKRMSIGIFLSESEPVETEDNRVTLGLPSEFQFHKETLERENNRRLVEEAFEVVSGQKIRVQFAITRAETSETAQEESPSGETEKAPDSSKMPEIITEAMNVFSGARIVRTD